MKVVNGQVMELQKALSESQDLNNVLINFKQNDESIYEGKGTDGRTYYIEVNKPTMCKVSIVVEKKQEKE